MTSKTLHCDIETFSSEDLKASGVYRYAAAPDFTILLFAYAFDDEPAKVIDLTAKPLPSELIAALTDSGIMKTAFNANFERVCLTQYLNMPMPPEQWQCTMVHALMAGLPGSLEQAAKVLKLEQQKMNEGKDLIRFFSKPCRPTRMNGMSTRNYPEDAPLKWMTFIDYCRQDVETERAVRNRLDEIYRIPDFEQRLWGLDQQINDRGIAVDLDFVTQAVACDEYNKKLLTAEAEALTGLNNTNSAAQIKEWLNGEKSIKCDSLNKDSVSVLLDTCQDPEARRLLEIRKESSKTSTAKYPAMLDTVCGDRIHGLLQFYGANRTGRWAGRLVQMQNLPQNQLNDLGYARELIKAGEFDLVDFLYGSVSDTLSQLIRTAFVPSDGNRFIVADFNAIEARCISWLADERWRLDVFKNHGKIYEASAAQMFSAPIESITKGSPLRQKGKVAELALGYNGGPNALIKMGALKMGLSEADLPGLVDAWRSANPRIVRLWKTVNDTAINAVEGKTMIKGPHGLKFIYQPQCLFIELPSGRRLSYRDPVVKPSQKNDWGQKVLFYDGVNQTTRKWETTETYGGKLTENIIQSIARDCLAVAMTRISETGYMIVMHVHDEAVIDAPIGFGSVEDVCKIMGHPIAWAPGLPLKASGFEADYYKKD